MSVTRASDVIGGLPDPRRLIAVVYADMVGYSRLIGLDDLETLERLRRLRSNLIDPAIEGHGGRIVQTGGDSLLMVFNSIDGAVRCAVKVQQDVPVHDGDQPPDRAIRFRVGINIGDAIADGTDLHGDAVNVAVRLQAECPPGGICVSRAVRDHVHDRLDLDFEELGSLSLKNIARPVEAFVLKLDADQPARRSACHDDRRAGSRPSGGGGGHGISGKEGAGLALPPQGRVQSCQWVLLYGPFTRATGEFCSGSVPRQGRSKWRPSRHQLGSRGVPRWRWCRSRTCRPTRAMISSATELPKTSSRRSAVSRTCWSSRNRPASRSRTSNASPADIGRQLNARYLLAGSIRRAGNRVRVSVELTEATTGRLVWSETYDAEVDDIFAVQDKIAKRVVGAAAVKLTRFEQERVLSKPTRQSCGVPSMSCAVVMPSRMKHVTTMTRQASSFRRPLISIPTTPMPMRHWADRITRPSFQGGPNSVGRSRTCGRRLLRRLWHSIRQRRAPIACSHMIQLYQKALRSRARADGPRARDQSERCGQLLPIRGVFWCGQVEPQRHCRGWRVRSVLTGQWLRSRKALHGVLSSSPVY